MGEIERTSKVNKGKVLEKKGCESAIGLSDLE